MCFLSLALLWWLLNSRKFTFSQLLFYKHVASDETALSSIQFWRTLLMILLYYTMKSSKNCCHKFFDFYTLRAWGNGCENFFYSNFVRFFVNKITQNSWILNFFNLLNLQNFPISSVTFWRQASLLLTLYYLSLIKNLEIFKCHDDFFWLSVAI